MIIFCERLGAFADGELPLDQAEAMREHLATCQACQANLEDILQLKFLEAQLCRQAEKRQEAQSEEQPQQRTRSDVQFKGPTPQRRRERQWTRKKHDIFVVGGMLALAASLAIIFYLRDFGRRGVELTKLARELPYRPIEARLSYVGLSDYRPYSVPAGGRGVIAPIAHRELAEFEGKQDWQALAAAYLWTGDPERAATYLERAGRSAEIENDRAVLDIVRGDHRAALGRINQVLSEHPKQSQALWNRALLLSRYGLPMGSAEVWSAVAAFGEPGWSKEAEVHSARLRADALARSHSWSAMSAAGQALISNGTLPATEIIDRFPDELRLYFYDAVRAAPDRQRLDTLKPLAQALGRHFHDDVLEKHIAHISETFLAGRAPLAAQYRQLATDPSTLAANKVDDYLAQLRTQHQSDILLGALLLTRRVGKNVQEYAGLARATGDEWFELLAEQELAQAELTAGDRQAADRRLLMATQRCGKSALHYRCAYLEYRLGELYTEINRLVEARQHALLALRHAQQINAWDLENSVLALLGTIAFFENDYSLTDAYVREVSLRNPEECRWQRYLHDLLAMVDLFKMRVTAARQNLMVSEKCGTTATVQGLLAEVDLSRLENDNSRITTIRTHLEALRNRAPGTASQRMMADFIEGRLLLRSDRANGEGLLRRAITQADAEPSWNAEAAKVRAYSYRTLVADAGRRGAFADALASLSIALKVTLSPSERCVLGVARDDEQLVIVARGADGGMKGRYEGSIKTGQIDIDKYIPSDMLTMLPGCASVAVLALPPFQGQPDLLPKELAWSYRLSARPRQRSSAPPRHLVVSDIDIPAELALPRLSPWPILANAESGVQTLTGRAATPTRVLAEMVHATDIDIHAHGLVNLAVSEASFLVMSPEIDGSYQLTARQVQSLSFDGAPLILLSACHAAKPAPFLYTPWSLPRAFVDAGARAVLAATVAIPSAEAANFFAAVRKRIATGASPATALRDERLAWMQTSPQSWVKDILLFE